MDKTEHQTTYQKTNLMKGKKGLVMGVANDRSIAWGIAQQLFESGAELAFSYQGDALLKRVAPLAAKCDSDFLISCDVSSDDSIESLVEQIKERWGKIDFLVHAVAFSDKNQLKGEYMQTSRDNF